MGKKTMSPQDHKYWVNHLLTQFDSYSKDDPLLTPEGIIRILATLYKSAFMEYKKPDVVKVSQEFEKGVKAKGLDVYSDLPIKYQFKEQEIVKSFIKERHRLKNKSISDSSLLTLIFGKALGIRQDDYFINQAIDSDKNIKNIARRVTHKLTAAGFDLSRR